MRLLLLLVLAGASLAQDWAPLLDRRFPQPEVSYLIVRVRSCDIVAARWPNADTPLPVGSLVKPFTALAYGESHRFLYPEVTCRGERDGCWLAQGHGRMNLVSAVEHSCNAYFLALARDVGAEAVRDVSARFGVPGPRDDAPGTRIGLGRGWMIAPAALARAYCELASRAHEPGVDLILAGMAKAAAAGTAMGVGRGALAKTGTAPCVTRRHDSGDGFVIALYPAEAPRLALLVRVHGVPGAEAAKVAGGMLRVMREGE